MSSHPTQRDSYSAADTFSYGIAFGEQLPPHSIVCFFGDLAAGKTTFIKGLAVGAAGINPDDVQSPTFTYLNIYEGRQKIYHFDLYRLRDIDEFLSMGFDEYWERDGICCIEWSEKISSYLPLSCIQVQIRHLGENHRMIMITYT